MEEKYKEKTAFSTGSGLYQFTVMPLGLCNTPPTFERWRVLVELPWHILLIFLDDVIVHGNSFEEVLRPLWLVFQRFWSANLRLRPKKCLLCQQKVTFLGHVVSGNRVGTNNSKTEAVSTWPVPSTVAVISFLGLSAYYCRSIQRYVKMTKPLHEFTESGKWFVWTQECDTVFCRILPLLQFWHTRTLLIGSSLIQMPVPVPERALKKT